MFVLIPLVSIIGSLIIIPISKLGRRVVEYFSVLTVGVAAFLVSYQLFEFNGPITFGRPGSILIFMLDSLSLFMLVVVNYLGLLIILYSIGYMANDKSYLRYYFFMLLFIGSMSGLVISEDLIMLYIFWEIVGICSAFLIAFWWNRPRARMAGLKAFAVTRAGDFAMLIGMGLSYMNFGITYIPAIVSRANGIFAYQLAVLFIIAAFAKSAQFPFHVLLPDAMEGPTPVSALIHAATMVNAGVYLISRIYPLILLSGASYVLVINGLLTCIMAEISAIASIDIKKILAYSTISNIALMFVALGAGNWTFAQLHLYSHAIFKALLFLVAGSLIHKAGTRLIGKMRGILLRYKLEGFAFTVGALSLAGIPGFPGALTKDEILRSIASVFPESIATIFSLTISILTALYISRLLFILFIGREDFSRHSENLTMGVPILTLALATIIGIPTLGYISGYIFNRKIGLFTIEPLSLSGTLFGILIAFILWGKNYIRNITWAASISKVANKCFYIDDLYTAVARAFVSKGSRILVRLQSGVPSMYALWTLFSIILFLIIVLVGGV